MIDQKWPFEELCSQFHKRLKANRLAKRGIKTRDYEILRESSIECTFKPKVSDKSRQIDRLKVLNTPEPRSEIEKSPDTGVKSTKTKA